MAESLRGRWPGVVIGLALAVGVVALVRTSEDDIGEYGLIQALSFPYFVAVAAIIFVMVGLLRRAAPAIGSLSLGVVALVVLVDGAASIVESEPRFPVAWLHAAFVESIMSLGETSPGMDARFSWPGFFSGAAALTGMTGLESPTAWLRWAPVILTLCYLPPLLAIGRATLSGWRGPWVGLIVFVMVNWVGQDYFAPQTVAYVLYLTFAALALTWLRRCEPGWMNRQVHSRLDKAQGRVAGWVRTVATATGKDREPEEQPTEMSFRIGVVILLAMISMAMVSSHQLTPVVLTVVLGLLAISGRFRPWPLAIFTGVALLGWLSYVAEPFWSGHLDDIFGSFGKLGSVIGAGVEDRVVGSPAHLLVVKVRMIFALAVWALAALGIIRLWRSRRTISLPLVALLAAPGFVLVAQEYGGEGVLRVFYYSLPGAVMLVAALVVPGPRLPSIRVLAAFGAVVLISFPAFLVAKWGNEEFERVTLSDLDLERAVVQVAPPGSTVAELGYGGSTSYSMITSYRSVPSLLASAPFVSVDQVNQLVGNNPLGTFLIIERPQVAYGVINDGLPSDFAHELVQMLVSSGQYKIVAENSSGVILERIGPTGVSPFPGDVESRAQDELPSQPAVEVVKP